MSTERIQAAKAVRPMTKWLIPAAVLVAGSVAAATWLSGGSEATTVAASDPSDATVVVSREGLYHVSISPKPAAAPINELHVWTLSLRDADGERVGGARIEVDGDMPAHGHGLPTSPVVEPTGDKGDYSVQGMKFQMGGEWFVEFAIDSDLGSDKARIDFTL